MAVNSVADALSADSKSAFTVDDDPQPVGQALPFALKSMEAVRKLRDRAKRLFLRARQPGKSFGSA